MKKLIPSLVMVFMSLICIVIYNIIGSKVLADGTLVEPFYLIPLAWLFLSGAILVWLINLITNFVHKKAKNKI